MLKVGLTGGIAAGKSVVGEMFVALGACLVQADRIAHSLMLPGEPVYNEVVRHFGREILNRDGSVNRDKLAEKSDGFTGAEIEQAVVSALFDEYDRAGMQGVLTTEGVIHSIAETVPLSRTMKEKIATLRAWCRTRARPASSEYQTEAKAAGRALDIDTAKAETGKPT